MTVPALRPTALTPGDAMALIERITQDIESVESPDEAALLVKQSEAVLYLAEKAESTQRLQNAAAMTAIKAKRRAGEILAELIRHEGGRPSANSPSLGQIGISRNDSSRWQRIAAVDEERLELWFAEQQSLGRELTTAGVLRLANVLRQNDAAPQPEPNTAVPWTGKWDEAAGMQCTICLQEAPRFFVIEDVIFICRGCMAALKRF